MVALEGGRVMVGSLRNSSAWETARVIVQSAPWNYINRILGVLSTI